MQLASYSTVTNVQAAGVSHRDGSIFLEGHGNGSNELAMVEMKIDGALRRFEVMKEMPRPNFRRPYPEPRVSTSNIRSKVRQSMSTTATQCRFYGDQLGQKYYPQHPRSLLPESALSRSATNRLQSSNRLPKERNHQLRRMQKRFLYGKRDLRKVHRGISQIMALP